MDRKTPAENVSLVSDNDKHTSDAVHFSDIRLEPPHSPARIIFEPVSDNLIFEENQQSFLNKINNSALRVSDTIRDPADRTELLEYLLLAAKMGLGGARPDLQAGQNYFKVFKLRVVRAAERERRGFIRDVWRKAWRYIFLSIICIFAWFVTTRGSLGETFKKMEIGLNILGDKGFDVLIYMIGILGFSVLGLVMGIVFSVFISGRNITFQNFDQLSLYKFQPGLHFLYLFSLTTIALFLLYYNVIVIGFGDLLLNDFVKNAPLAFFVGLTCAWFEAIISGRALEKTRPKVDQSNTS